MQTKIYGQPPILLERVHCKPSEICYVQYLPIKFPQTGIRLPENLNWTKDIVKVVADNFGECYKHYIYLTAKYFFCPESSPGNRPGWHSDGFMTEDINYIWYDSVPTEFCLQRFNLSQNHETSMNEMNNQAHTRNITTYDNNAVLRLDESVIHRVSNCGWDNYRAFVKISFSLEMYNLAGNAHNELFNYSWYMEDRIESRNHPIGSNQP